ncbi:MAG: tRNA uridine-5-carboxymethylaminomethyl(34) synthesis GTPase MnmE [Deltaproteobacteria bacterium]|nr:tRNA uridine-5-carboxymethylaminomethyl(34) synthesis GTPase MnmE [Deltaproteobacteria bacterium]
MTISAGDQPIRSAGDQPIQGDDTVAAIATAAGPGGVGIVRVSGPRAIEIVAAVLHVEPPTLSRELRLGWAHAASGTRVDQVLAFAMRAPASFTGEDVAELQGHGGTQNLQALLAAVIDRGARIAEPGEFTRRAVANGKLDLLRAEALLSVIQAGSDRAWRQAQHDLEGRLGEAVADVEARALKVLAELEGWIDFPESDLDAKSREWITAEIAAVCDRCGELAGSFRHGRAMASGIAVALVGAVNVGKSSLLNALVGVERALVAPSPGTTRDWLEVQTVWDGVAVTLIDTAGLRDAPDPVERRGIELGETRVAAADVVVVINDGTSPWDDGARFGERALITRSKGDLGGDARGALVTSAKTGDGLPALRQQTLALAGIADREGSEAAFVTTARQHGRITAARDAFAAAYEVWVTKRPPEVVAIELRAGAHALAELRGVEVGERVLDEVFARFCIGK